jgi:hypothetical protein
MPRTLFADKATLMSPRTVKYVAAMIREGDGFDYNKWLTRVREEEAEAKQTKSTGTPGEEAAAKVDKPICTSNDQHGRLVPPFQLATQPTRIPRVPRRPHCRAKSETSKVRLRRWLEKVCRTGREFQANRARDAVYDFLAAVYALVMHFKVRRRTTRLLRHAFEFADLPFDKNADTFSAVIRCTSGNAADTKMISKWSRALRYASRRKEPDTVLKTFLKQAGGVNACANLYAKHFGRNNRVAAI